MSERILEGARDEGLVAAGQPVVVLFSGGRDSTCLLDLAVRIAGVGSVTALHLNYGLRDAAIGDERHCVAVCERLGTELQIQRPRRPEGGNLQAWAREERYAAARLLASERGADVAAGHTASDQIETILYRLASSPSRRALLGMRPREGGLVRPLLRYTREETAAYCTARGLPWREDETNRLDTYARSRIRSRLVPALREVHPAAEQNVLSLAAILRAEAEVLDAAVDEVLEGRSQIELARLRSLAPALRALVVQRLADEAAGEPAAGVARRAEEVAALSDHGRAALDLPHGVRALAEAGTVRFERTPPLPANRPGDAHRPREGAAHKLKP